MRRKKVEPPPKEEPKVEVIPCEDCGHGMLATDSKCAGCGAEYEIEAAPQPQAKPPQSEPSKPAVAKPAAAKPQPQKPNGAGTPAVAKPGPATSAASAAAPDPNCWSCGTALTGAAICPSCGIEQGDDIPFAFNESVDGWEIQGIGERWNAKVTTRRVI
jgi:hypothetical protein